MKKDTSGKILVIFSVISAILLISLTAISIFFFQKEVEKRKSAESNIEANVQKIASLENKLSEVEKQKALLEDKYKEADDRINSLLDDLELEKGLREEMKQETTSLKDKIDALSAEKKKLTADIAQYKVAQDKIKDLEARLAAEKNARESLEINKEKLQNFEVGKKSVGWLDPKKTTNENAENTKKESAGEEVKLEPIVVNQSEIPAGRVLSVDRDTEFVIVNLGSKDGLESGKVLAVYRGNEFLGDIQITRVQPEMSAADLIPPFSSQRVRKNDQVVAK